MKVNTRLGIIFGAVALAALTACGGTGSGGGYYAPESSTASSGASSNASSASGAVHTAATTLGIVVVNGSGMTVYFFDHDKPQETASACTGPCLSLWPPVTTTAEKPSIAGVTGTVGTITGTDGVKQLTLNGLPLYTFAGDKKTGDITGQGYGGIWWVVDPSGAKIAAMPASGGSGY